MSFMKKFLLWVKSLFSPPAITAPSTDNPPYIDYSNDYIVPVPGKAADSWLYCFPIKGKYQQMQQIIDQRLNFSPLNKQVKYFPLSETMMMVFSDIRKGYSLDTNYPKYGFLKEQAIQIFMPIAECTLNAKNEWVAQRILVYIPYILVDQPFNLSIGREEFGFAKAFGQFEIPTSPEKADHFNLNAFGFEHFNKDNPEFGKFHPFVNIKKINGDIPEGQWQTHQHAWDHIKQYASPEKGNFKIGLPFLIHEIRDLANKTLPMLFLKQFRDIAHPEKACYQAITEGNGITDKFYSGWLLGSEYEINITNLASFPICADLGLENTILVKHPFWVHCDMRFDTGTVIWKSN
jgi:hypothetical protein